MLMQPGPKRPQLYSQLMHSLSSLLISSLSVTARTGLLFSILRMLRPYNRQALIQANPQEGLETFSFAGMHRL
jgi:hypothetical protein